MAIDTLIPFTVMCAAVNGKILPVVIEIGRRPSGFVVAGGAISRELSRLVVGVGGLVVVFGMAAKAGIGRVVVVPVVTGRTFVCNDSVGPVKGVVIIVVGKAGRHPVGRRGMAGCAIGGKAQGLMVGVGGLVEIGGMAGNAPGRRALVSVGMTGQTFHGRMRAGQRELGGIVVEGIGCAAVRMASQAGRAVVGIPADIVMLVVGFGIGMTGGTRKFAVIRFIGMAFRTLAPGAVVSAAVNGEMIGVMQGILGRHPTRVGGMTGRAIRRETGTLVVWAQCPLVIGLVTGKTGIRGIRIAAAGMAPGAILDVMAFGQREKIVGYLVGRPIEAVHIVAIDAVGGKTGLGVIRVGGGSIIGSMAIDAVVADPFKLQRRFGNMTLNAIGSGMGA